MKSLEKIIKLSTTIVANVDYKDGKELRAAVPGIIKFRHFKTWKSKSGHAYVTIDRMREPGVEVLFNPEGEIVSVGFMYCSNEDQVQEVVKILEDVTILILEEK